MSQVTETICDQCGARKGKQDRWYVMAVENGAFHIATALKQWEGQEDLCSESCAIKALGDFLDRSRKNGQI